MPSRCGRLLRETTQRVKIRIFLEIVFQAIIEIFHRTIFAGLGREAP